jgi:hypothetical protein
MVTDAFRSVINSSANRITDTEDVEEEIPNPSCQRFFDLLKAANEPIYEGCSQSKLSILVRMLAARANWHIPQRCVDFFAEIFANLSPSNDNLPKNYYEATRLAYKLGLEYHTIDCCKKGCMLYYKEDAELKECKFCGMLRFKPKRDGIGKYKDVPESQMFYFPIIPRLQRLYASTKTRRHMRWHKEKRSEDGVLRHLADGLAWKHFDNCYPDFANESRNVRLGLCRGCEWSQEIQTPSMKGPRC